VGLSIMGQAGGIREGKRKGLKGVFKRRKKKTGLRNYFGGEKSEEIRMWRLHAL